MAYVNIYGINIYYEIYGESNESILLYLHGGPGSSCLDFVNMASQLSQDFCVISFDQWGVLRSDPIAETDSYSVEIQADMIEQMRRELNIQSWSLLGHSYGGVLAAVYANKYPNSVNSILLECPSLNFADSTKSIAAYVSDYIRKTCDVSAVELCGKMISFDYEGCDFLMDLLKLLSYVKDQKLRNYLHGISYDDYRCSYSTEGITGEMWAKSEMHLAKLLKDKAMAVDYLPVLKDLNKPILLLKGKYDPVCSTHQTDYIKDLKNATVVEFANSGHFPRIEEPVKYQKAILNFFND